MQTTWAYISNYFVYSAMGVFALSFFAHAFETAWAVRAPEQSEATTGSVLTKTLDYTRTERAARIATHLTSVPNVPCVSLRVRLCASILKQAFAALLHSR